MKQIDLSVVNEDFLKSYLESIDIEKIKANLIALKPRKYKRIIDELYLILTSDFDTIKTKYLTYCDSFSDKEKKEIEKAFNYTLCRKKENFIENFKKLNIKSCPFCNNNYVYFYKKDAGKYNTIATLEHYYPKSKYPHLSLSFFNLIPSCNTCNSKFKGTKEHEGNILHPYIEDFNEKANFSVVVDALPIKKDLELKIGLSSNDKRCKNSIDRFQLDKIYDEHRDIAKEIWNKTQVYNDDRINELYESFYKDLGYSKEDVKNFAFCSYLDKNDINRRNHTKLTQDILKQFELLTEKSRN